MYDFIFISKILMQMIKNYLKLFILENKYILTVPVVLLIKKKQNVDFSVSRNNCTLEIFNAFIWAEIFACLKYVAWATARPVWGRGALHGRWTLLGRALLRALSADSLCLPKQREDATTARVHGLLLTCFKHQIKVPANHEPSIICRLRVCIGILSSP